MSGYNTSREPIDFLRGCVVDFDRDTGRSHILETGKCYLSQMKGMFADSCAYAAIMSAEDPIVYEYHQPVLPIRGGDLVFGCSIVHPGKVGDEYFFTKGHFHHLLDVAETYYCLRGHGYMLLENPEGDWSALEMKAGDLVYVPGRYAHRSINVSPSQPLITLFNCRADAGHDYGTIESRGFRKRLVDRYGIPTIVDNARWK